MCAKSHTSRSISGGFSYISQNFQNCTFSEILHQKACFSVGFSIYVSPQRSCIQRFTVNGALVKVDLVGNSVKSYLNLPNNKYC